MLKTGTSKHRTRNAEFHKKLEFIQRVTKCYLLKNGLQVVGQIKFLLLLINHNIRNLVLLRKNYSHYAKQYLVK